MIGVIQKSRHLLILFLVLLVSYLSLYSMVPFVNLFRIFSFTVTPHHLVNWGFSGLAFLLLRHYAGNNAIVPATITNIKDFKSSFTVLDWVITVFILYVIYHVLSKN